MLEVLVLDDEDIAGEDDNDEEIEELDEEMETLLDSLKKTQVPRIYDFTPRYLQGSGFYLLTVI